MLELAIANNIAWYSSIFRAHDLPNRVEEHFWTTDADPPPYYSHLVTRTRGAVAASAQLKRLSELAARQRRAGWGLKDSFDELPGASLEDLGLRRLFSAQWFGWVANAAAPQPETRLTPQRVASVEQLFSWEEAWRRSSPAGELRVFPRALLSDASMQMFAMVLDGRSVGGFALNQSDGAVGLSNVFQLDDSAVPEDAFLRDCARGARLRHPDRAVVGYGREADLRGLAPLGFEALGPLTVWVSLAAEL